MRKTTLQEKKENSDLEKVKRKQIKGVFEYDPSGKEKLIGLSFDGRDIQTLTKDEVIASKLEFKRITGLSNVEDSLNFLLTNAEELRGLSLEKRFHHLISFLHDIEPSDHIEARLLTQFLILDETANELLSKGKSAEMVFQGEFFYKNSIKFRNLAQQAINSYIKYKSKGTQQINIMHMYDNSKAVIANKLSQEGGRGV